MGSEINHKLRISIDNVVQYCERQEQIGPRFRLMGTRESNLLEHNLDEHSVIDEQSSREAVAGLVHAGILKRDGEDLLFMGANWNQRLDIMIGEGWRPY